MKYSRLGDTGLIVSRLSFGSMTFGPGDGKGASSAVYKVDQAGADRLVAQALDAGINHFNSADAYAGGQSEVMLGKALGPRRRDVVVSTKVGNRTGEALVHGGLSRRQIMASAEASLKRLGTDYIDVYLTHKTDPYTPLGETLAAFDALVKDGKVRYVGFSNWPAWMAASAVGYQRANHCEPFRAGEIYYSLVGRDAEAELIPFAQHAGIGLMVWSPLAGGFLSGKYSREDPSGGGGRLSGFDFIPVDRHRGYMIVDALKQVAPALNASPPAVAIAWLLTRPGVATVLLGASRAEQLKDNLAAADLELPPDVLDELERVSETRQPYPQWFLRVIRDPVADNALGG
jgi:aryl-alcohol dehydrogenase-like predicted oxidoreductase